MLNRFYKILFLIVLSVSFFITAPNSSLYAQQNNEQELFLVAEKAFEDGFYDVAIRYIDQLMQQFPQTDKRVQAHILLGQCYFFKNQYLKAYEIFQSLTGYNEYNDAVLFWLGETNLKGSDYLQADKQYNQLINLYPDSAYVPQAFYSLGWSYFEQGKYAEAKKIFLKLINQFPLHQLAEDAAFKVGETEYNAKNYENAIQYFKEFLLKYPQSSRHAESYFFVAESYYYLENTLEAITYYAKAADISYDNQLTLMSKVSLGWSYLKLGKHALAKQYFDEAQKLAKEKGISSDDVYLGQANLYSETEEYPKALEAYTYLIENFPDSHRLADAYLGRANIYYQLKDYTHAVRDYRVVIDKYTRDITKQEIVEKSYFGLAWTYLKAGQPDLSIEMFKTIKDKAESKTVKVSALTQIGDAYQDLGQFEKALEVYDQIMTDYPESPYIDYVQYRQGITLLKMNKIDAATLSFQTLQTNFPQSKYLNEVQYYLAVSYFNKEAWIEAKEKTLEFIKNVQPPNELLAEANYILGLSLYNLKDYTNAIETFQKIMKNFPEEAAVVRNSELNMAKCFYKMKNPEEAKKILKLIPLKYADSEVAEEAFILLGDYTLDEGDLDNALIYYQEIINKYPNSSKKNIAYYEIGQVYQAKKEFSSAIDAFKKVNSPEEAEMNIKAKMAIADIFSKELNSQLSIETYQSIISSSPEFKKDALIKLADIYKSTKEYDKVIQTLTQAMQSEQLSSETTNPQIQFLIADTYETIHEKDKAVENYLKIPYIYPEAKNWGIKSFLRIAKIYEDDEKWEEAKTIYQKASELNLEESKFANERLEWINENIFSQK